MGIYQPTKNGFYPYDKGPWTQMPELNSWYSRFQPGTERRYLDLLWEWRDQTLLSETALSTAATFPENDPLAERWLDSAVKAERKAKDAEARARKLVASCY